VSALALGGKQAHHASRVHDPTASGDQRHCVSHWLGNDFTFLPICTYYVDFLWCAGAAIGPQLTGVLTRNGWHDVFYMLMAAEFAALLVSFFSPNRRHIFVQILLL